MQTLSTWYVRNSDYNATQLVSRHHQGKVTEYTAPEGWKGFMSEAVLRSSFIV